MADEQVTSSMHGSFKDAFNLTRRYSLRSRRF